jgi:hypothetical protein
MAYTESQFGQFSHVLQSFIETLTEEQKSEFRFSTLEGLQATIVTIQNRQSSERKMRNLARLRRFLEAIEEYGKVIEVFVNTSEFVCFIWVCILPDLCLRLFVPSADDANISSRAPRSFYFRYNIIPF